MKVYGKDKNNFGQTFMRGNSDETTEIGLDVLARVQYPDGKI